MNRKPSEKRIRHLIQLLPVALSVCLIAQCALTGSVVDYGNFETSLTDIKLEDTDLVRVYCGGSRRYIPLKNINTLIINPAIAITVDRELYFGADITLKDGSRIQSRDKDRSVRTQAFVCVHQRLIGRRNGEEYRAGFEHILRLTIN